MPLSKKDIEHIARLARLELTDKDVEKYAGELSAILEFVKKLDEVDTKDVAPLSQAAHLENALRKDDKPVFLSDSVREAILNQAPDREEDFVKVKAVFDK